MASIEDAAREQRKAKAVMVEPDPVGFLSQLQADFTSSAASKEREACDLEDRMLALRAEAQGLRHAAGGLEEAVQAIQREHARAKEFADVRDGRDQPSQVVPHRARISDDPEWVRRG